MRRRKKPPTPAAGSMADIGFLLLIFFMVSTTMIKDKGIQVVLPEYHDGPAGTAPDSKVLDIKINKENKILVEGENSELSLLKDLTKNFIDNPLNENDKPNKPSEAIISIQHDAETAYESYIAVYDQLKLAVRELRELKAQTDYKKSYQELNNDQQNRIRKKIPFVVSEAEFNFH